MAEPSASTPLVVGVFVGGQGSRMGGVAKGLLKAPNSDATLLERLLAELRIAVPEAEVVLVGDPRAYASLGLSAVSDEPPGIGPLGGLLGLLLHAQRRGAQAALAVACDLPRLSAPLLQRLAHESNEAGALVTTQAGVRNPLIARYAVALALPAARAVLAEGTRSLQAVLDRLGQSIVTLALTSAEEASLADWDTPEDVQLR